MLCLLWKDPGIVVRYQSFSDNQSCQDYCRLAGATASKSRDNKEAWLHQAGGCLVSAMDLRMLNRKSLRTGFER